MYDMLDLSGTRKFQVNYCQRGVWKVLGGKVRPSQFTRKIDAEHALSAVKEMADISATMIVVLDSAYYSDLADRNVYRLTEYTVLVR